MSDLSVYRLNSSNAYDLRFLYRLNSSNAYDFLFDIWQKINGILNSVEGTTWQHMGLLLIPHWYKIPLQWRHNSHDCVSNHQPHDCLLHRLFTRKSKKTPKLRVTGLCAGNSPVTGEFPAQLASNAENVPFDDVIMLRGRLSRSQGLT